MKFLREIPRYLHFIGIGGAGMSSIARFLLLRGFKVSGSDLNYNEECKKLENLGALIFKDQSKSNLQNVGLVIVSSAIKDSNEELIEARKLGITILKRAQMLFELMRYKKSIAVCGTHGKSTSTAMLYHIYQSLTLDPSVVNGANILGYNYSSNYGKGESFIFEADESDGSFSFYHPYRILLTNMEADHLENYNNEFSKMVDSYINFINQSPYYNKVIINSDIENYQNIVSRLNSKVISFGFSKDATYYISNVKEEDGFNTATISFRNLSFQLKTKLYGVHNILNALGAYVLAIDEGLDHLKVLKAIETFNGILRRLEYLGEYKDNLKTFNVIDDYGHHPTEVEFSIKAVKSRFSDKRLVTIFQPHRYSRTKAFLEEFSKALIISDYVILLDIYSAGDRDINNISSLDLLTLIKSKGYKNIVLVNNNMIYNAINSIVKNNDILLIQGAGNIINLVKDALLKFIKIN